MVEGGKSTFGFEESSPLQVKIVPLRVQTIEFSWVSDVTGLQVLIVVFEYLC